MGAAGAVCEHRQNSELDAMAMFALLSMKPADLQRSSRKETDVDFI